MALAKIPDCVLRTRGGLRKKRYPTLHLAADAVQQHVHGAQPRRGLHQLPVLEALVL